jgi:hypothetical protein
MAPPGRAAALVAAAVVAGACEPDDDFTLPWWRAPRAAAPSPLLDAVGLVPPALRGPGCFRGPGAPGFRAALARLADGFETTCFVPPSSAGGGERDGYAAVTFDGRGHATSAERRSAVRSPAAAAAAADSVIRRGLRLPGARPIACRMDGWPYGVIQLGGPEPVVHGWRTPAYEALVLAYPAGPHPAGPEPAWPDSAAGHVVHVRVSGAGFSACGPRRAGGGGGGA